MDYKDTVKDISLLSESEVTELNTRAEIYLNEIKLTGIREVVEWVGEEGRAGNQYWHSLLFPAILINTKEWEAQLKVWGIKQDKMPEEEFNGQAELFFAAGQESRCDWHKPLPEIIAASFSDGKKAGREEGREEVIEWIEETSSRKVR